MRTAGIPIRRHPWLTRHPWFAAIAFVLGVASACVALPATAHACDTDVVIRKVETGAAAPGGTYTILMTGTDFQREVTVTAGDAVRIPSVPPGTYTFSEVGAPSGATIVPEQITVTRRQYDQEILVVVTNPYLAGRLAIEKVETGDTAPGGTYTFDITGPVDLTATVTAGTTWTSDWLPLGTYTITERDAPEGATIEPNPVILDTDGTTVTVTATNPYRDHHARLAIEKVVAGGGSTPAGPWTIDITGPVDMTITLRTGETWTSEWLPLGTYTVTERDAPVGATISPNPVVLDTDGATVTVTVTNPAVESSGGTTTTTTTTTTPRVLAATGSDTTGTPTVAGVLVLAGAALVIAARRRQSAA